MKVNLELVEQIMEFIDKTSQKFKVPKFIIYDYIKTKATDNGYTIIKQVYKINSKLNQKDAYNGIFKKKLYEHWETLRTSGANEAFENFNKFNNYCLKAKEIQSSQTK